MVYERFEKGHTNSTVIGAITLQGIQVPMMLEGAGLEAYVRYLLVPQLRHGDSDPL